MTAPGGDIDAGRAVSICPHCGYDLEKDAPVEYGRLSYDPRIGVMLDGKRIGMTPQAHSIVGTLMREPGRAFKRAVLSDRMGYSGDNYQIVDVVVTHARRHLREAGVDGVIVNIWGVGLYFDPAPLLNPPAAGRTSGSHLGASATTSARPFLHSDHRVASKEVV